MQKFAVGELVSVVSGPHKGYIGQVDQYSDTFDLSCLPPQPNPGRFFPTAQQMDEMLAPHYLVTIGEFSNWIRAGWLRRWKPHLPWWRRIADWFSGGPLSSDDEG